MKFQDLKAPKKAIKVKDIIGKDKLSLQTSLDNWKGQAFSPN